MVLRGYLVCFANFHRCYLLKRRKVAPLALKTNDTPPSHFSRLDLSHWTVLCLLLSFEKNFYRWRDAKEHRVKMHSFLASMSTFINKKPSTTNHNNFICQCQVYSFEATNDKLNPALKQNIFEGRPT